MRLPHSLLESQFFALTSAKELVIAMGDSLSEEESDELHRLAGLGLPPVSSALALSTMMGINPGLLWSMLSRPTRHYRRFTIPKGRSERVIFAPRVALKIIQKWLSIHFEKRFTPLPHVYGFVRGKSHIQAAKIHTTAQWVYSTDIEGFFPSTPIGLVVEALMSLGYNADSAEMLAKLCCINGHLAQGSPASPVISNIVLRHIDAGLQRIAGDFGCRLSRYADDIVFSGAQTPPADLGDVVPELFLDTPWRLAPEKTHISTAPRRLKVHALLVHGAEVRLTKGYRNRLRAFRHLIKNGRVREADLKRIQGHLHYADHVAAESVVNGDGSAIP
ncbi:RNA-directed DNA polymerase [Luteimonas marina]|uniref:RNA-directed DNA polymerase n=1 Tax=Luteimonas marina TaxID=488485 RepID=A0A5C5U361_9GAMM|nr:reverse transcriptase family protein [Luteimonas marina]TWT20324.1 RNA-directed DNA polymerase [Luteimonas marina]